MRGKVRIYGNHHLSPQHARFVIEYVKDYAGRRAAQASGFAPEYASTLLDRDDIKAVLGEMLSREMTLAEIDADWLLAELKDNHEISRYQGNMSTSNAALNMIGKHKRVDAFAADKIKVTTDADAAEQLSAGLQRAHKRNRKSVPKETPDIEEIGNDDEVSFL